MTRIEVKRICQYCNKEFIARTTVTKSCSDNCAKRLYKLKQKEKKIEASNIETLQIKNRPIEEIKQKPFLNVEETCTLLGISKRTIYRMLQRGELNAGKLGKRIILKRTDIDSLFTKAEIQNGY